MRLARALDVELRYPFRRDLSENTYGHNARAEKAEREIVSVITCSVITPIWNPPMVDCQVEELWLPCFPGEVRE